MDFVIYFEHETRELQNCMLIKKGLSKKGFSVELVQVKTYRAILYKTLIRPKVLIVPYCYSDRDVKEFVPYNNRNPVKIINLQWEQVLSNAWEKLGYHNPRGTAKDVYHVTWGPKTKERLTKNNVNKNNILLTGAIHLDFLKSHFRHYFLSKEELSIIYKIDKTKKWVLYISSFVFSSLNEDKLIELKERFRKETEKTCGNEIVDSMFELTKRSREKTLDWVDKLLESEDIVFIYRPHPSEKKEMSDILKLKEKYPNKFDYIAEYSVSQWIMACDISTTWFSTSIIEAYYADKPCFVIRPIGFPEDKDCLIFRGSEIIDDYETFREKILQSDVNSCEYQFPLNKSLITDYYGESHEELVCQKICNNAEKLLKENNSQKYPIISNSVSSFYFIGKIIEYLMSYFYILTGFNIGRILFKKRFTRINRHAVKELEMKMQNIMKRLEEVKILE